MISSPVASSLFSSLFLLDRFRYAKQQKFGRDCPPGPVDYGHPLQRRLRPLSPLQVQNVTKKTDGLFLTGSEANSSEMRLAGGTTPKTVRRGLVPGRNEANKGCPLAEVCVSWIEPGRPSFCWSLGCFPLLPDFHLLFHTRNGRGSSAEPPDNYPMRGWLPPEERVPNRILRGF